MKNVENGDFWENGENGGKHVPSKLGGHVPYCVGIWGNCEIWDIGKMGYFGGMVIWTGVI